MVTRGTDGRNIEPACLSTRGGTIPEAMVPYISQ